MSTPAVKFSPAPRRITTLIWSSSATSSRLDTMRSYISSVIALSLAGRFSVILAMWLTGSFSYRTSSSAIEGTFPRIQYVAHGPAAGHPVEGLVDLVEAERRRAQPVDRQPARAEQVQVAR